MYPPRLQTDPEYRKLCEEFLPTLVHNNEVAREVSARLDHLEEGPRADRSYAELCYCDLLCVALDHYRELHLDIESPQSDQKVLQLLMAVENLTEETFYELTGVDQEIVGEVLAGREHLDRAEIDAICVFFELDPRVFAPIQACPS
jgi:hypothetical protein